MTGKRRIYLRIVVACLLLAIFLSLVNFWLELWAEPNGDITVYVRAGRRMTVGAEIYRPEDRRPFTYPPFLAVPFIPVASLPALVHRPLWFSLNLLAFVTILFVIHRNVKARLRLPGRADAPRPWVFWLLLMLLSLRFVSSCFENQSNDLFIVLLVALCADAARHRREAASGALAGLGAALKATPLLFLPVFLWQRRWVASLGLAVALVAVTLLPDALRPRPDGQLWAVAWYRTFVRGVAPGEPVAKVGGAWAKTNILNQNLAGTLYRLSTPVEEDGDMQVDASLWRLSPTTLKAVTLAAQLLVLVVVLWAVRARRILVDAADPPSDPPPDARWRRWGEAGAVACGMVLLSPMSSKSHFAILILPISFCLVECLWSRRSLVLLAHLVLILAFGALTTKGIWGRALGNHLQAYGTVTLTALVTLSATAYALLRPRHRES